MKIVWIVLLVLCSMLPGCNGGNEPVNQGKDKPVPPKKENDKSK